MKMKLSFQEIGIGFGQSFILIKNKLVFLKLLQKVFQGFVLQYLNIYFFY